MAGHGSSGVDENQFDRVKEHLRHGADRMVHLRFAGHADDAAESKENGPAHMEPRSSSSSRSEEACSPEDRFNYDDLPFDPSKPDPFTSELASVADDDDGIASPKSQSSVLSLDTMNSSVSGQSWSSNQRTIGGFGIKEWRAQEQLGPYKPSVQEEGWGSIPADQHEDVVEPIPSDYRDYVDKNNSHPHDMALSADVTSFGRSSSTSSDRSAPDSLYADLSSISTRDMQVSDGLLKADGFDSEGSASPIRASHIGDHISNLKLRESSH